MEDWQIKLWIEVYAATLAALSAESNSRLGWSHLRKRAQEEADSAVEALNERMREAHGTPR